MMFAVGCAAADRPDTPDLSQPPVGGGGGDDLAEPADLAVTPDLAVAHDLSGADLKTLPDLKTPTDMVTPPDLTPPPDMTGVPVDMTMACMPPVAGGACGDYPPQCGCAAGQNCLVVNNTNGATGCVAAGTIPNFGGGCTGNGAGQCMVGSQCIGGVCTPICKTPTDCGGGYNTCGGVTSSSGTTVPGLTVCSRTCDPVNPQSSTSPYAACGASTNCYPADDHGSFCLAPVGSGTQGSDCSVNASTGGGPDPTKCAAGFGCLTDDQVFQFSSCYKFCHVGSNADCTGSAAGKTCTSFGTKLYAGPTEVGYCS
jgi:hypothetical protein